MCFHLSFIYNAKKLGIRFNKKTNDPDIANILEDTHYYTSAFNFPLFPVITKDEQVQIFNWGLIPSWTKSKEEADKVRVMILNAKSETIFEKPSFKSAITTKRCIVPCTGFFEFRHEGKQTIPYYIHLTEQEIFSIAGVYSSWIDHYTYETINTFSILTTTANPLMEHIHNTKKRMPVILNKDAEEQWLSHLSHQEIASLLKPFNEREMSAYEVANFLKKSTTDSSVVLPVQSYKQSQLF